MHIGILQTGPVTPEIGRAHGDYAAMFRRLLDGNGFRYTTWEVHEGDLPDGPGAADGWLITGSRHGVYEPHGWIPPLEALIRAIAEDGSPLVGICFGHQIVAQALGGRVEKAAQGWSVGCTEYPWEGGTLSLNAWHQDQVVTPPPGSRTLSGTAFCPHAALAIGDTILTVQAHPEFPPAVVDLLIQTRGRGIVPDPLLEAAAGRLDRPVDDAVMAKVLARHLLTAGRRRAEPQPDAVRHAG